MTAVSGALWRGRWTPVSEKVRTGPAQAGQAPADRHRIRAKDVAFSEEQDLRVADPHRVEVRAIWCCQQAASNRTTHSLAWLMHAREVWRLFVIKRGRTHFRG